MWHPPVTAAFGVGLAVCMLTDIDALEAIRAKALAYMAGDKAYYASISANGQSATYSDVASAQRAYDWATKQIERLTGSGPLQVAYVRMEGLE